MLIHITPRLFVAHRNDALHCELIDLSIEELGLTLKGGKELATRSPYANKRYLVGCRKIGQKAMSGILINTSRPVKSFTAVARWAVNAGAVLTHRTNYVVLDDEFDAVSDSMVLWYATSEGLGGWKSRWPTCAEELIPASAQPRMDIWPTALGGAERTGNVRDTLAANGLILERFETFNVPTIERDRLLAQRRAMADRIPAIEMAFTAG